MLLRSAFPGKWKNYQLKIPRRYSIEYQSLRTHNTGIVSTNIAITGNVKLGRLETARKLFDEMSERTVVSWNAMISGYSKWGRYEEALNLVSTMHHNDIRLTETSFLSVLSACANSHSLVGGKQFHGLVLKGGYESFKFVGSSLLYLYANCFKIAEAKQIFEELHRRNELLWSLMLVGYTKCNLMSDALDIFAEMPKRDVVAWTMMISGYAKNDDDPGKALEFFLWMKESGEVKPNEFTLDSVLRACGRLGELQEGRLVHGVLLKYGFESDQSIGSTLIEFYCKCEAIDDAKIIYEKMANPCLNSSNFLLDGLIMSERINDAEKIFNKLKETNSVSYNLMIKGFAMCGQVEDAKRLFEKMPCRTIVSSNTMISLYSRNGEIDKALKIFEQTKEERNPATWNSMITGYVQNERFEEGFGVYVTMHRLSIGRTRSTFSVLFHACSCLGSLQQGQLFHGHLAKTPFESNVYVGTSLIHMYSKCGTILDSEKSFMSIKSPNVAAWTALINGYSQHGLGVKAISLFENMLDQGVNPNAATFVGILSGCCHAGLVREGLQLFNSMETQYGVVPTLEHDACIVSLLGRSGHLLEAEKYVEEMPIKADGVVWGALLSASWFWKDMKVGERVAAKMLALEHKPVSSYVVISNMYAELGKWEEKLTARKRLRHLELNKDPGLSWIELSRKVHVFSVDNRTHPDCNLIYFTLEHLTANLNSVLQVECDYAEMKQGCHLNTAYLIEQLL